MMRLYCFGSVSQKKKKKKKKKKTKKKKKKKKRSRSLGSQRRRRRLHRRFVEVTNTTTKIRSSCCLTARALPLENLPGGEYRVHIMVRGTVVTTDRVNLAPDQTTSSRRFALQKGVVR